MKHSKCTFLKTSVQYLGHRIDAEGLHTTDDKVRAITEALVPNNAQELRSFLGLKLLWAFYPQPRIAPPPIE